MRALLLLCAGLLACKQAQPEARRVVPPSEQEAEAFAKDFVTHVAPCNANELDLRIDDDLVIARAFAKRKVEDDVIRGFKRGFGGVGVFLCRKLSLEPNVAAAYLRSNRVDGTPRPIVRLVMDGAINYLELELDKHGGKIRVADILIYMAGERLSDVLGSTIDVMLAAPHEAESIADKSKRLNAHVAAAEWQQAHDVFKSLPAKFRATKAARLTEIQIAAELGDDVYLAAMESYVKAFPNDPSLTLVQIDRAFLKKQYAEALRALDQLDRRVGGDPYLDALRADALRSDGKPDKALEAATRATKEAPELVATWWSLLTQQVASARYAEALPTVEVLRDRFQQDVTAATLASDDRFRALAESAEFAAWAGR